MYSRATVRLATACGCCMAVERCAKTKWVAETVTAIAAPAVVRAQPVTRILAGAWATRFSKCQRCWKGLKPRLHLKSLFTLLLGSGGGCVDIVPMEAE